MAEIKGVEEIKLASGKYFAVIGKNFGDEGKGMCVDWLCRGISQFDCAGASAGFGPCGGEGTGKSFEPCGALVVRANGGAQSGHTVERAEERFVFHELSSGSFCHADTYWAPTFHPDLFKLREETEGFRRIAGFVPKVYASYDAGITLIDDVLLNEAVEQSRGAKRHGSCGMGIYECGLREEAGFKVSMGEAEFLDTDELRRIRREYVPARLAELGLDIDKLGIYGEMLKDDLVLENFAEVVRENAALVELSDFAPLQAGYDRVIFENGQGLLLDSCHPVFQPHVTASRTGLTNVSTLMKAAGLASAPLQAFYVSRAYVTRHCAGPLPYECAPVRIGAIAPDATNLPNPWQGTLRFAPHASLDTFESDILADLAASELNVTENLLITHLNETSGDLVFADGRVPVESLHLHASHIYTSYTK